MTNELMRDFVGGAAFVGNLSAFYYYAYTGCQLPVGVTLDRFGPRRVLTTAAVVCTIGALLFAFATSTVPAYVGRTLIGAGSAFAWIGSMKLATVWFPPQPLRPGHRMDRPDRHDRGDLRSVASGARGRRVRLAGDPDGHGRRSA